MTSKSAELISEIKVVAFDFDQTLVDETFSIRRRWEETLRKFSHLHAGLEKKFLLNFDAKGHKHKTHLNDALAELGISEIHAPAILDLFRSIKSSEEKVYTGVKEAILLLKKRKKRVGIITDGYKSYQEDRIRKSGLHDLFDFFYYGDEHQKPDPAFFQKCIEGENVSPREFLYVGDDVAKDIEGALRAGVRACFIGDEKKSILPEEAFCFKTMYDFQQWLKRL